MPENKQQLLTELTTIFASGDTVNNSSRLEQIAGELAASVTAVGSFKKIIPLSDGKAVAITDNFNDMCKEVQMLNMLRDRGFNALQVYGQPAELNGGRALVLMDYVDKATFVDAKTKGLEKDLILSLCTGVPLSTHQEAFALGKKDFYKNVLIKMMSNDFDPGILQEKAANISSEIQKLLTNMQNSNTLVGDLQILIDQSGKITIIDPLDVLELTDPNTGSLRSVIEPEVLLSKGFVNETHMAIGMLMELKKQCDSLAKNPNLFLKAAIPDDALQEMSKPKQVVHSQPSQPSARDDSVSKAKVSSTAQKELQASKEPRPPKNPKR